MKGLKAFIKPFEPPKMCENKNLIFFYFNTTLRNAQDGKSFKLILFPISK